MPTRIPAGDRVTHHARSARALRQRAGFNRPGEEMTDKPVTTYLVSVFEKPHWRTVLSTKDKAKALTWAREIGDKVRIEEVTPVKR